VSRLLSALPGDPGSRCPQLSFTRPLRRPGGGGLSPPLDYVLLRGALPPRPVPDGAAV